MGEEPEVGEPAEADLAHDEATDRHAGMCGHAVLAAAAEHHHDACAVARLQGEHRRRRVEAALAGAGHPQRHPLLERRQLGRRRPEPADVDLATIGVGHPGRVGPVDVDLLDHRVAEVRLEGAGAGEIGDDTGTHVLLLVLRQRANAALQPLLVDPGDLFADPRADEELLATFVTGERETGGSRGTAHGVVVLDRLDQPVGDAVGDQGDRGGQIVIGATGSHGGTCVRQGHVERSSAPDRTESARRDPPGTEVTSRTSGRAATRSSTASATSDASRSSGRRRSRFAETPARPAIVAAANGSSASATVVPMLSGTAWSTKLPISAGSNGVAPITARTTSASRWASSSTV